MTDQLLHYGVVLSWALSLIFFGRFALQWWRREPNRPAALGALAAITVPAALLACLLPPRGGYDNGHDFSCLGTVFFTLEPRVSLLFKEYSPLFTDGVADLLSGFSLRAVLWKNRLLPALSAFALFGGLRRLGASLPVCAAGTALLFLNFLSPLNASAFSTTSANLFIWLLSLLALADAHAAPRPGAGGLAWVLASLVLVISARFEFLPVNLLLLAAVLKSKPGPERKALLRPVSLLLLLAGAGLLAVWGIRVVKSEPQRQLRSGLSSAAPHLVSQLGDRNLSVIAGGRPDYPAPGAQGTKIKTGAGDAALAGLFLLAALAGALADPAKRRRNLAAAGLLLAWAVYFAAIFGPPDHYPLQFMRHQLYFFVPFVLLFALGVDGCEGAARGTAAGRLFPLAVAALGAAYGALNARAALAYNGELRTNDRELAFLSEAQSAWPAGCLAVCPKYSSKSVRADLIAKYFPGLPERGWPDGACLLKYASPEAFIFTDPAPPQLAQAWLLPGPGPAWRQAAFSHAFYTEFRGGGAPLAETAAPVPLTLGFFRLEGPRDEALLLAAKGARALAACDRQKAARLLRSAAEKDPSCLNCRYLRAVSEAASGGRAAAWDELEALGRAVPGGLAPEHLVFAGALASGDAEAAEAAAQRLETGNPYLFFGVNLKPGLRCGQLPSTPIK